MRLFSFPAFSGPMLALAAFLFLAPFSASASHNLGGDITYRKTAENEFEITLTTFTDPFAKGVDRCTADLEIWEVTGPNPSDRAYVESLLQIPRANGPDTGGCAAPARFGEFVRPHIKRNFYKAKYTFSKEGQFEIRYFDVARPNGVNNMQNSGATAFYVRTSLSNFSGFWDASPMFLNDPLDDACLYHPWNYNPGMYDPDGDSLVCRLMPCQQYDPPTLASPTDVANYQYLDQFGGPQHLDASNGFLTWDSTGNAGIFQISIWIEEWRDGQKIGETLRDMTLYVVSCTNRCPGIITGTDTVVSPGERLSLPVYVSDPDSGDSLYVYLDNGSQGNNSLFRGGASFVLPQTHGSSNLGLEVLANSSDSVLAGTVTWDVDCQHLQARFYQGDFYVHDKVNGGSPSYPFGATTASYGVTKVYVRPKALTNVNASATTNGIRIRWSPAVCPGLVRYEIYRSATVTGAHSDCRLNGPAAGFQYAGQTGPLDSVFLDSHPGSATGQAVLFNYYVVAVYPGGIVSCVSPSAFASTLFTGVPESLRANGLEVMPNPSSGIFTLRFTETPQQPIQVQVQDLTGRMVYEQSVSTQSIQIGLPNLPNGVYLLRFSNPEGEQSFQARKLVLQR